MKGSTYGARDPKDCRIILNQDTAYPLMDRYGSLEERDLGELSYERQYGVALSKEVLCRRGVIATRVSRETVACLDDEDRAELDAVLSDIEPLFMAAAGNRRAAASRSGVSP